MFETSVGVVINSAEKVRHTQYEVMWQYVESASEISAFLGHINRPFRLAEKLQILHLGINGRQYQSECPSDTR